MAPEIFINYSRHHSTLLDSATPSARCIEALIASHDSDGEVPYRSHLPTRQDWIDFIASSGPYTDFWTVSFIHPYEDEVALKSLAHCLRAVNRELWGTRWLKNSRGLSGLVVAEPHKISLSMRGRLHFHILLRQPESIDKVTLYDALNRIPLNLKDANGKLMTAANRIDSREIWRIDGLACYLTKKLGTSDWASGDNIFFVEPTGIEGCVLPVRAGSVLARRH